MKPGILTLVATCIVAVAAAQPVLSDRWKETRRLDLRNKPVPYTDTMKLQHVSKEGMDMVRGSFLYKGRISNDVLEIGDLTFGIVKNTGEEIRLQDEESIHIFSREIKDTATVKLSLDLPPAPVAQIDKQLLKGDWEAYKRANRKGPAEKVDYGRLLKTLSFSEEKSGGYYGSAATDHVHGNLLYHIKDIQASQLIAEDKAGQEQKLTVWKLSAAELVLEDGNGVIYYMKHFR